MKINNAQKRNNEESAMQTNEITPTPTNPEYHNWVQAAYGRSGNVTYKYKNLSFTPEGEARVMQIAGWICGLIHGGQSALAESIATDINSRLEYLNGYGGMMQGETFRDGSPVPSVPRYIVKLSDDGTFGGFDVAWYKAMPESEVSDENERGLLNDRWGYRHTTVRWKVDEAGRESKHYVYQFVMNGGLLYHGPAGGEVFAVSVGETQFWGIHT